MVVHIVYDGLVVCISSAAAKQLPRMQHESKVDLRTGSAL